MNRFPTAAALASVVLAGCGAPAASAPPRSSIPPTTAPSPAPGLPSAAAPSRPESTPSPPPTSLPSAAGPVAYRIAFLQGTSAGQHDVFVASDRSGVLRLTEDERNEHALFWLQDGSRLAFSWSSPTNIYRAALASVLPDGTDRKELGPVQTIYSEPVVSPDGRYVAYGGDGDPSGETGIVLLDLHDGSRIQLTTDGAGAPVWSPDGSRILALAPSRVVVVIDVPSGEVIARIEDETVQEVLGWSADGSSVIYGDCDPGCGLLPATIANADGSSIRRFDGPLPMVHIGVPSPDGASRAYVDGGVLVVSDAAGTAARPVSATGLNVRGQPTWSGDGRWLAFSAGVGVMRDFRIYIVSVSGGTPLKVTSGPDDTDPAWQPG